MFAIDGIDSDNVPAIVVVQSQPFCQSQVISLRPLHALAVLMLMPVVAHADYVRVD